MSGNIETRLRALEMKVPADIVLMLRDGTTIEHPGPPLAFFAHASEQIAQRRGALFNAAHRIVSATGCGKLHEVLLAMVEGPVEQPLLKPLSRKRRRSRQRLHG